MCLCTQVQGPEEDKRWHWIPGAGVPGGCGLPEGEPKLEPLEKQYALLIAEPFLQPFFFFPFKTESIARIKLFLQS